MDEQSVPALMMGAIGSFCWCVALMVVLAGGAVTVIRIMRAIASR